MTAPRGLRAHLASLSPADLQLLLDARPDVLRGAPLRDLDDLAGRLANPNGVGSALLGATWAQLQVLEALTACGAGASHRRAAEILSPAGSGGDLGVHDRAVAEIIAELTARGFVWPTSDGIGVSPGVQGALRSPCGLGRPAELVLGEIPVAALTTIARGWRLDVPLRKRELVEAVAWAVADPERVRGTVELAPAEIRTYLVRAARRAARLAGAVEAPPAGPSTDAWGVERWDNEPVLAPNTYEDYRISHAAGVWAREHGVGFSAWEQYGYEVETPSEVKLALLPTGTRFPFYPDPPPLPVAAITPAQVSSSAAGALTVYVSAAMATLEALDRTPLASLKNGGVGVREMTNLAKRLGVDAVDVRLTLELALPLGLLGRDRSGKIRTSPRFDEWRGFPPPRRAAELVLAWMAMAGTPTIERDEDDKALPALTRVGDDLAATARRETVLLALAGVGENAGLVSPASLARFIQWRSPIISQLTSDDEVEHIWNEAERLGVAAHGAISDVGHAAARGDLLELDAALTRALPAVQRTALFGSDLTVVVPGSPDAAVVDLLDAAAVREARGAASTWRITPASVRSALDDGFGSDQLLDELRAMADGELPQALEYLVRDVGRRYGVVQVAPASAVLVGDDEALLAELEVHKALRRLGLRRVAPTVLVAAAAPGVVVNALRAAGYLPRAVDERGAMVIRVGAKVPAPRAVKADEAPAGGPGRELDDEPEEAVILDLWAPSRAEPSVGGPVLPAETPELAAERLVAGLPPKVRRPTALEDELRASAPRLSVEEVRQLAFAVAQGQSIRIEHRAQSGKRTSWVLSKLAIHRGVLTGWSQVREAERRFTLSEILAVSHV